MWSVGWAYRCTTIPGSRCKAVAVAGQTHACYAEEGYMFVGTSRLLRTDLKFDGGLVHELATNVHAFEPTYSAALEQLESARLAQHVAAARCGSQHGVFLRVAGRVLRADGRGRPVRACLRAGGVAGQLLRRARRIS